MKYARKRSVGRLLIAAGCLIISCALGMWSWGQHEQWLLLAQYEAYALALPATAVLGENEASIPSGQDTTSAAPAILAIPKLDLKTPLAAGLDDETLKYGVGHFEGTAQAGQAGNFCVAGHSSGVFQPPFSQLDKLSVGDTIEVIQGGGHFVYKVSESFTVKPEEVWVLNPTEDAQITLVTCTPPLFPTHRLIIKGILVPRNT